jgi:hypothetical protein
MNPWRTVRGAHPSRACSALLLRFLACVTTQPSPKEPVAPPPRIANLQRAAALPWEDDGRCVVQEWTPWSASTSWYSPNLYLSEQPLRVEAPRGTKNGFASLD